MAVKIAGTPGIGRRCGDGLDRAGQVFQIEIAVSLRSCAPWWMDSSPRSSPPWPSGTGIQHPTDGGVLEIVESAFHSRPLLGGFPSLFDQRDGLRRIGVVGGRLESVASRPVAFRRENEVVALPVGELERPHLQHLEKQARRELEQVNIQGQRSDRESAPTSPASGSIVTSCWILAQAPCLRMN